MTAGNIIVAGVATAAAAAMLALWCRRAVLLRRRRLEEGRASRLALQLEALTRYAGDAVLLDYIYGHHHAPATLLGRRILEFTTNTPASRAVRIRAGIIDARGRRLKAVAVHVGTDNPVKVRAVRRVFDDLFDRTRVRMVPVASGVPEQPFDQQAPVGAMNRARAALQGADFGVGIEAGLLWDPSVGDYLDVQYCAIVDRAGRVTLGHGPGFEYPPAVVALAKAGATVGEAMAKLTGIREIGSKYGAIGFLTERRMDRDALTEAAVLMAMVPRIRRELYAK